MIGVLTTSYPRHAGDFSGRFVLNRVRTLAGAGVAVEVIAAGTGPVTEEHAGDGGVVLVRVPFALPVGPPLFYADGAPEALESGRVATWLQAWRFSANLLAVTAGRSASWTSIESHWLVPCGLVGAAVARGRPHVIYAHAGDVAFLERVPGGSWLARFLWSSGANLVFVSEDLRRRFARLAGMDVATFASPRVRVAAMPVDEMSFRRPTRARRLAARRRLGLDTFAVVSVGRLVPIKGFDVLVRAVGRLPVAGRPTVVLIGDGAHRRSLSRDAESLGVDLRMPGTLPREQVADWLQACDVFAQPSRVLGSGRSEGMPLGAREALATGLPVIASASGGLEELARSDGRMVLVPPGDPIALAEALAAMLAAGNKCETNYAAVSEEVGYECAAADAPPARRPC